MPFNFLPICVTLFLPTDVIDVVLYLDLVSADRRIADPTFEEWMMTSEVDDEWEPEDCSDFLTNMPSMAAEALVDLLAATPDERKAFLLDTRAQHENLYANFTSEQWAGCAGNYRGADIDGVRDYDVYLPFKVGDQVKDNILFATPETVELKMETFAEAVEVYCSDAQSFSSPGEASNRAANLIVQFLSIHPFANGNGHITRLMFPVLISLTCFTIKPNWTINPSPYDTSVKLGFLIAMSKKPTNQKDLREWANELRSLLNFFEKWVE